MPDILKYFWNCTTVEKKLKCYNNDKPTLMQNYKNDVVP